MTINEFKAWLEGYSEAIEGAPNKKQWNRIQKRLKEVDGKQVVEYRYTPNWYPNWYPTWYTYSTSGNTVSLQSTDDSLSSGTMTASTVSNNDSVPYTLTKTAYNIGKQEAEKDMN